MVAPLIEILFIVALVAPPLAVVLGIAALFVPPRTRRASKAGRQMPEAA